MNNNSVGVETPPLSSNDFEKYIISITTDANYNSTAEYSDAFVAFDIENHHHAHIPSIDEGNHEKDYIEYVATLNATDSPNENVTSPIVRQPVQHSVKEEDLFSSFFGFLFQDEKSKEAAVAGTTQSTPTHTTSTTQKSTTTTTGRITAPATVSTTVKPIASSYNHTDLKKENEVPLKLLNILNVTTKEKKESSTKTEIPQRKNNKIINSNDGEEQSSSTEDVDKVSILPNEQSQASQVLRDVLLATLNGGVPGATPSGNNALNEFIASHNGPVHQGVNIESKSKFQYNPIRSELDLILDNLNKPDYEVNHNQYQYLPDDVALANTEPYVISPVDADKLKQHQSVGAATIITKPSNVNSDPAGLLKLAGCNIYGRMYRVGRIISELSNPCLLCKCTEIGVNCTPLSC